MNVNKWTLGLAAVGLISLPAMVQAEEKPNQLLTALSSTTISGYVDTSAHWTLGSGNANTPAYSFNTPGKQDGFNLNVVNLTLEKPLDEGTWSAGYKVELLFGPNANGYNPSFQSKQIGDPDGLPGSGDEVFSSTDSDVGIKQAYVALRAPIGNGIDFKLGTFDTIIGYEVFNAGSNPNYTRSWGYTMEPTQHTGLLASYQFNKIVGVSAGVANTQTAGVNARSARAESSKTWMAAGTLTAPEDWGFLAGSSLYVGIIDGFSSSVQNDVTSYYAGATIATPVTGLKLGASYDYAVSHDNSFGPRGYSQALGIYSSFQATEKLSLHFRGEWAEANFLNSIASAGTPDEVLALTGTVQYDLWANVLSRLEVRWDHALSGSAPFGGTTTGTPNKKNEFLVAANLIYKF